MFETADKFVTVTMNEFLRLDKLPKDNIDERYTMSFDAKSDTSVISALQFFSIYGFVVFRNVFDADECQTTRNAMWEILESLNPGFVRSDVNTWRILKSKGSYEFWKIILLVV